MVRWIAATAAVAAAALAGAPAGLAQERADPEDGETIYAETFAEVEDAENGELFTETVVGEEEVVAESFLAWEACAWFRATRGFRNFLGQVMWRYRLRVNWCYDGTKITDIWSRRWAEIEWYHWDFKGHIGWEAWGGKGSYRANRWTQGKFQLCAQYCFRTVLPWVEIRVNADGGVRYWTGD